jgi:hypothetical protein
MTYRPAIRAGYAEAGFDDIPNSGRSCSPVATLVSLGHRKDE